LRSVSKAECGSPSSFSMVAWPGGRGSRASPTFERKPGWEGALSLSPLTADSGSTNKRHARDAIPRRSRDPPLPQWRPNLPLEATLGLGPTPDLSGALLSLPGPRAPPAASATRGSAAPSNGGHKRDEGPTQGHRGQSRVQLPRLIWPAGRPPSTNQFGKPRPAQNSSTSLSYAAASAAHAFCCHRFSRQPARPDARRTSSESQRLGPAPLLAPPLVGPAHEPALQWSCRAPLPS
jgi:hypothetical protein